jgi:hypothetical protein
VVGAAGDVEVASVVVVVVAIVNGLVVKPLYFKVVDVAFPLVPPLHDVPIPQVEVAISLP